MKNALLLGVPETDYFADPCEVPSLTQSIAHVLISASPAHAWLEHPRLGGEPRKPTGAMDAGSLVHAILLGKGPKIHPIHADDWRKPAAREERDTARAAGELPALDCDIAEAFAIVDVVRPKLAARGIVLDGHSEVVALWVVETEYGPIQCRARMDHVGASGCTIYDLKTTGKIVPPHKLGRHFCDFGYEIQAAAYTQALATINPSLAGRIVFRDIVIETQKPHCVTIARPDGRMTDLGERTWARACEMWGRCLSENTWPEFDNDEVLVGPPEYEVIREDSVAAGF